MMGGLYPDLSALDPLARLSDRARNPEGINQSSYGLQRGNPADKIGIQFLVFYYI